METITIDDFLSTRPDIYPALIKTDVEGHDLEALNGMNATVVKFQPLILSECFQVEAADIARKWGYRIFAFVRDRVRITDGLKEIRLDDFAIAWVKMIFLVPPRLWPEFEAVSE